VRPRSLCCPRQPRRGEPEARMAKYTPMSPPSLRCGDLRLRSILREAVSLHSQVALSPLNSPRAHSGEMSAEPTEGAHVPAAEGPHVRTDRREVGVPAPSEGEGFFPMRRGPGDGRVPRPPASSPRRAANRGDRAARVTILAVRRQSD
jgi:hypothetical protein